MSKRLKKTCSGCKGKFPGEEVHKWQGMMLCGTCRKAAQDRLEKSGPSLPNLTHPKPAPG